MAEDIGEIPREILEPLESQVLAGQRAVVIGASIAGLAAAEALARQGAEVVLVDRDDMPEGPEQRDGVRHGDQMHNFLVGGQDAARHFWPGYEAKLRELGAGFVPLASGLHVRAAGVTMPSAGMGRDWVSAQRPVYEAAGRNLLSDNVEWREQMTVTGLEVVDNAIRGVRLKAKDSTEETTEEASIVVDATGMHGLRPIARKWLEAAGVEVPRLDVVEPGLYQHFSSIVVDRLPDSEHQENMFRVVLPNQGTGGRGVVSVPVASDKWHISANRRGRGLMPGTFDQLIQHASAVEQGDEVIANILRKVQAQATAEGQPLGDLAKYTIPELRSVRYEKLEEPVEGFFATGDALATTNPMDGQGLTRAIILAKVIEIVAQKSNGDMGEFTRQYHKYAAAVVEEGRAASGGTAGMREEDARDLAKHFVRNPEDYKAILKSTHLMGSQVLKALLAE